ncbi:MAG: hypothetical protein J6V31_02125 [Tidjanibacter sp.]|nr:hypothetical protein [Tidjanibacter sp.]
MLSYRWKCYEWDIGGKDSTETLEGTLDVAVGTRVDLYGFKDITITSISQQALFLSDGTVVMKGTSEIINRTIDGHEDHDGVLWSGEELSLTLTYK